MKSTIKLAFLSSLIGMALATDTTVNPSLDAKLKTDATQLDRLNDLPSNSDWLFDFYAQPGYSYSPGSVVNANAATFPATVGNGMTMAMLSLGPCAMLPPHYHPRASNYVVAVAGTTNTYMIEENGARLVSETLTPGKMTIFPAASLHTMQNMGCDNATLISALNSEDTGTHNVVNGLFNLPADIVMAAFGQNSLFSNISAIAAGIPSIGTGSVAGSEACLVKCGLK